jgi:hypothetical protein
MTFNASMSDLRSRVRRATDTEYATARHPDADLNIYITMANTHHNAFTCFSSNH